MAISGLADQDVERIVLNGSRLKANITRAITEATLHRNMDVPYLELRLNDPDRDLLRSKAFQQRSHVNLDDYVFYLRRILKQGSELTVTFEPGIVSDLRRLRGPKKARAGTTTRTAFARSLVREVRGAKFRGEAGAKILKALVIKKKENYWEALRRLADERQWRCFENQGTIFFGSDKWLLGLTKPLVIKEREAGVHGIDFDFDVRRKAAIATVECDIRRWAARPGHPVDIRELGEAVGKGLWLVDSISRSLYRPRGQVSLLRRQPELPEPKPDQVDHDERGIGGNYGAGSAPGAVSSSGYQWPMKGTISSPFGPRRSGTHYGIDIAAPTGTPIRAAKPGYVIFAGVASGYGNAVYVQHENGHVTRYGHFSSLAVHNGQRVGYDTVLGRCGATGNASGPHLHFEIRIGGIAVDPARYLP